MPEATPQTVSGELKRETLRKIKRRVENMDSVFVTGWLSHFKELVEYYMPRNGLYLYGDESASTRGKKKGDKIINNKGMISRRVLAAGLQSGLTSHARAWIYLTVEGVDGMPVSVKEWLANTSKLLLNILANSNFYSVINGVYDELGVIGTGVLLIEEDFDSVVRFRHLTVGEYRIATDSSNRVNTLALPKVNYTVENMVQEYGINNVLESTRTAYKEGHYDDIRVVTCFIGPNPDFGDTASRLSDAKFVMIEWERGMTNEQYLRISPVKEQNFAAARWQVIGTDAYGSDCPGMAILPEIKQLQVMEKKKLRALDKMIDPPLQAPTSLRNEGVVTLAGGVTFVDEFQGAPAVRTAYEVKPDLVAFAAGIQQVEERISRGFFEDVFLSFSNTTKRMTARETEEWAAEKLLMLGAVSELVESETLDVIVERVFNIADRFGLIPPPPPELDQTPLKIEYTGMLSQAQKLSGAQAVERFIQVAGAVAAQLGPEAVDELNTPAIMAELAGVNGVPPSLLRDQKDVAARQQARQEQQNMMMAAQMAQQGAAAASDAAKADATAKGAA